MPRRHALLRDTLLWEYLVIARCGLSRITSFPRQPESIVFGTNSGPPLSGG
jgi:hypothetical protein